MTEIIGIVSGKGGVGKTTLVANLALSLKELGKTVIAVDCNITTPHLSFYLGGYDYSLSLNDVLRGDTVITSASYYHDGIFIVPASQNLKDLDVDISRLKDSLKGIENVTDVVLLDSAPGLGREAMSVLDACDKIIFVTVPFSPAVNDLVKCTNIIKRYEKKILGTVLNMVRNEKYELKSQEIESITEIPVIAEVPFDKDVLSGLNKRIPILKYKPDSSTSIECMKLAAKILGIGYENMVSSGFYPALKRLTGFPEATFPAIEVFHEEKIKTDADRILDILRLEKSIKISELAKRLNLSKRKTRGLSRTLEKYGLVKYYRSIFGDRLRVKE